jgi:hypothetical protein
MLRTVRVPTTTNTSRNSILLGGWFHTMPRLIRETIFVGRHYSARNFAVPGCTESDAVSARQRPYGTIFCGLYRSPKYVMFPEVS